MKIKNLTSFLACVFALAFTAAATDVYDATAKHVETGGIAWGYQNGEFVNGYFDRIPDMFSDKDLDADIAAVAADVCRILLDTINPKVIQASAFSDKEVSTGIYRAKNFAYLGNNMSMPSFFDICGKDNTTLDWQQLPADTRLAFKTVLVPGPFVARFVSAMRKSKNNVFREMAGQFSATPIPAVLNSINGEFSLLIKGSTLETFGLILKINDSQGVISAMVKSFCPPQNGSNTALIPVPAISPNIAPKVIYGNGELTLVSHDNMLKPPAMTLAQVEKFKSFAAMLPESGTSYFVLSLDQETIDFVKLMSADNDAGKVLCNFLSPFALVGVSRTETDGYAGMTVSDFSISQKLPEVYAGAIGGMVLPALNQARSRARSVHCCGNEKQIATALLMYSVDHNDTFPAENGINGLKKLVPDYLNVKVFSHRDAKVFPPALTAEICDYIFIGGGINVKKLQNPSSYPVLFDKPSAEKFHKGNVNVLFADGHVKTIIVKDYSDPRQVIGTLNAEHKYAPELLKKLLDAVAEN